MSMEPPLGGKVLCVGIMCLDIINHVDRYPKEDEDVRAKQQTWQSGGNCTNTAKVLALIGRQCEFLGSLGSGMETDFGIKQMDSLGISHNYCPVYEEYKLPVSHVILNITNGSRTIVHYRDLPELSFDDFLKVDIAEYAWIHFEGRNSTEYVKMIKHIQQHNNKTHTPIKISIEVEKCKIELLDLVPLADLLIVSKDMAQFCGCSDKVQAVTTFRTKVKNDTVIVCPWGADGAAASDPSGKVYISKAHVPTEIMDTIGAGDTFNAGLIHSQLSEKTIQESLDYACKLAGTKCGMLGYDGLKVFGQSVMN